MRRPDRLLLTNDDGIDAPGLAVLERWPPHTDYPHAVGGTYHRPISKNDAQRVAARLTMIMAMICVRNSKLEDLHAGQVPTTHTGDYSDVFVVDADGRHIPWPDVSRIGDDEMRALMRGIVNRLYTFHLCADAPGLQAEVARWMAVASRWDEPAIDPRMLAQRNESR